MSVFFASSYWCLEAEQCDASHTHMFAVFHLRTCANFLGSDLIVAAHPEHMAVHADGPVKVLRLSLCNRMSMG